MYVEVTYTHTPHGYRSSSKDHVNLRASLQRIDYPRRTVTKSKKNSGREGKADHLRNS